MKAFFVFTFLPVFTFLSSPDASAFGRHRVSIDTVTPSSILSGDATGLAEGCGQQPSPLGMFCRQVEGDAADKTISFIGPPAICDRANCVFITVFNNQGALVWGDAIPKGQTRITVPWSKLLGCVDAASCKFQKSYRGTWTFNTKVYFKDPDGKENESVSTGDIILRIFSSGYVPLNNVVNDPNFVWEWTDSGILYRVTSGLRAYAGKVLQ